MYQSFLLIAGSQENTEPGIRRGLRLRRWAVGPGRPHFGNSNLRRDAGNRRISRHEPVAGADEERRMSRAGAPSVRRDQPVRHRRDRLAVEGSHPVHQEE